MDDFSVEKLFVQENPELTRNQYTDDPVLRSILKRMVPPMLLSSMEPELERMGDRVIGDLLKLHLICNDPHNEPELLQYNGWGQRIDEIKIHEAWKKLIDIACEEGIVATAYEKKSRDLYGSYCRVLQFAKLYLFEASSSLVCCPLSMTDGGARLIEQFSNKSHSKGYREVKPIPKAVLEAFARFSTRDPSEFWTSGQWMTEKTGGSDVSNTETIAIECRGGTSKNALGETSVDPDRESLYSLYGYKFFTSAITSDAAFALARIKDKNGITKPGSSGLSLFFLRIRKTEKEIEKERSSSSSPEEEEEEKKRFEITQQIQQFKRYFSSQIEG